MAFIYNILPRKNKLVGHWVSIFIDTNSHIEYFDSYGLRPPRRLFTMMRKWSPEIVWNKKRFQAFSSNVCGLYAVYYIHFKCHGWSLKEIQQHFDRRFVINDKFVTKAIKSMINFL